MPTFDYTFTVKAPLKAVADFHRDARVLRRLSPPPLFVQLHHVDPMGEGAIADFTLWFGPLPLRWVAVHSNVSSQHGFTDTQQHGPLKSWRHTHRFEAIDAHTTRIYEHIEYEYPSGLAGLLARLVFSPPALWFLFTYRRRVTRRALEGKERRGS
ncbi:MAG: SRPBCC family protein [Anaerolineales bacterium]|nr:SRPBCC family protein [Anaerolineales bacterium]